jgi:hypothetical protein
MLDFATKAVGCTVFFPRLTLGRATTRRTCRRQPSPPTLEDTFRAEEWWGCPAGPTRQQANHQGRQVHVGRPRAGVPWPQNFCGRRAAASFPHGCHQRVLSTFLIKVTGSSLILPGQLLHLLAPSHVDMPYHICSQGPQHHEAADCTVQKPERGNLIWACLICTRHILKLYLE